MAVPEAASHSACGVGRRIRRNRRQARADRARGENCRRRRAGLLDLPALHRGIQPAVEPGNALAACRLPDAARVPDLSDQPQGRPEPDRLVRRGDRRPGLRIGLLSLGVRGRPDPALGRCYRSRPRRRRDRDRAAVRGGAARAGHRAAYRLRDIPRLWRAGPVSAIGDRAPRLRLRPDHRSAIPRQRRHLRDSDAGLGNLHLSVHPVRLASSSTPA